MAKKTTPSKPKKTTATTKKASETELKAKVISGPKLNSQEEESTVADEAMDIVTPTMEVTKSTNSALNEPLYAVADPEKIEDPKATNDLSTYQLSELLTFRDANGIVMSYYDNLVKSCTGNYDAATKSKYGEWMKMRTTYQNLDLKILEEIEKRVNLLL